MTDIIPRLRALIASAPRGPWKITQPSGYGYPSLANGDGPLAATGTSRNRTNTERLAFVRYVATIDPPTLTALLDILEDVTAERDTLLAGLDILTRTVEQAGNVPPLVEEEDEL